MKTVTIRDVRHRWPETEKALAREGEILITRDAKPVAKLVRVDPAVESRARFDPEEHAAWQRRVGGRRATRWVDGALAAQRADRGTEREFLHSPVTPSCARLPSCRATTSRASSRHPISVL